MRRSSKGSGWLVGFLVTVALTITLTTTLVACSARSSSQPVQRLGEPSLVVDRDGCDLYSDYVEIARSADIYDSEPVLRDELRARHQRDREWRAAVLNTPLAKLHPDTARLFAAETAVDKRILEIWGPDGVAVTQETFEAGTHLVRRVLATPINLTGELGDAVTVDEYMQLFHDVYNGLALACLEPYAAVEPGWRGEIPAIEGHVLFSDVSREVVQIGSIDLSDLTATTENSIPALAKNQWSFPQVSPDNRSILINSTRGDAIQNLLVDRQGKTIGDLTGDAFLRCGSWSADGLSILATTREPPLFAPEFVRADLSGERIQRFAIDADLECPTEVDQGIVFTGLLQGRTGLWLVDHDGSNRRPLLVVPGCAAGRAGRAADGNTMPIVTSCRDAHQSGLYMLDVKARSVDQLVRGVVGAPISSSDGAWLSYVYSPLDRPSDDLVLRVMSADGAKLSELKQDAWWPTILLDGDGDGDGDGARADADEPG